MKGFPQANTPSRPFYFLFVGIQYNPLDIHPLAQTSLADSVYSGPGCICMTPIHVSFPGAQRLAKICLPPPSISYLLVFSIIR